MQNTILVIPDLHCPFQHADAFAFLKYIKSTYRPNIVVCLGDEIDAHSLSDKFKADPDGLSPDAEINAAICALKELYKLFPKVKVCASNHTVRPWIKAFNAGLPSRFMKNYKDVLEAPIGWQWEQYHDIDGIRFEHGEGLSGAAGALKGALKNRMSTVVGHIHSFAGVQYSASSKDLIWGMNCGCLIDQSKYAFKYGIKLREKPVLGCGVIINNMPLFIPMILDRHNKWIKR